MTSDFNFYIFREKRRSQCGPDMVAGLEAAVRSARDEEGWLEALLRAGELECALTDAGCQESSGIASFTDAIASAVLENEIIPDLAMLQDLPVQVPDTLDVSRPEGFAYYALHPLAYAESVERVGRLNNAVVIGIRSIGTTLSAILAAELRRRGTHVDRFTVRPHGDPYDRSMVFSLEQRASIFKGLIAGATFLITDEGPGLSGSSFLSVAEALLMEGARPEQVVLLPGHSPETTALRAQDAAARWARFRCVPAAGSSRIPRDAHTWIGAGKWRASFCTDTLQWPATWATMERPKYLSADGRTLWKFEGFGHYGIASLERATTLAGAGFSPSVVGFEAGYVGYQVMRSRSTRRGHAGKRLLRHIAEYCAFRAEAFPCESKEANDLSTMLQVNWEREFGNGLGSDSLELPIVRSTIVDGRMLPHKWIEMSGGDILKLDATSHGDDHFFPGPCDIAWDLAGATVELDLDAEAQSFLSHAYSTITGDEIAERLPNYLRAYATFRFAWSRMAAAAMRGTSEEQRLLRDYAYYRQIAQTLAPAESRFQNRNLVA